MQELQIGELGSYVKIKSFSDFLEVVATEKNFRYIIYNVEKLKLPVF